MLVTPTLEEVKDAGSRMKPPLPEIEAELFWYYYESNGWKVGKVKMVSFAGALGGWHCRWRKREANQVERNGRVGPGMVMMVKQKEYDRILEKMKILHSSHREEDRDEWNRLRLRRDQLRKDLGVMV